MMSSRKNKKSARRRKIILWVLAVVLIFSVVRFLTMRSTDKTAWPAGAPGVTLDIEAAHFQGKRLASPDDVAALMARFIPAEEALVAEYRTYQTFGITENSEYPLIDKRIASVGSLFSETRAFWQNFDGFDPAPGALSYNEFVAIHAELGVLACYAANAGNTLGEGAIDKAATRYNVISDAIKLTHGGGLIGRFAALNNVMLVAREMIMDPIVFQDLDAVTSYVAQVRTLETAIGSLSDALRTDLVSLHSAIDTMYDQLSGTSALPAERRHRIGRASATIIDLLGGNQQDTLANIDSLFSRLIHNASMRYSPEGLGKGLPAWCRGDARAPSTRDPIGSAVASSYLKHAIFAQAVDPSLILELRAMRIAAALGYIKQTAGDYPLSLDELISVGLLAAGDLDDPFAKDSKTRLVYARDGEGWRFYSVGLDQEDGGGAIDAYRTKDPEAQSKSDFVFISRERETRMGALLPKQGTAEPVRNASSSTNGVNNGEGL